MQVVPSLGWDYPSPSHVHPRFACFRVTPPIRAASPRAASLISYARSLWLARVRRGCTPAICSTVASWAVRQLLISDANHAQHQPTPPLLCDDLCLIRVQKFLFCVLQVVFLGVFLT